MILKNVVRAVLLMSVIAVNSWCSVSSSAPEMTKVDQAGFGIVPKFKTGEKTYDSTGKWDGCQAAPKKECVMMTIPLTTVIISDEGVILD